MAQSPKCDGLESRIARIGKLLDELEQLTWTSKKFSKAALVQTRADIERARAIIQPLREARAAGGPHGLSMAILSPSSTMKFWSASTATFSPRPTVAPRAGGFR